MLKHSPPQQSLGDLRLPGRREISAKQNHETERQEAIQKVIERYWDGSVFSHSLQLRRAVMRALHINHNPQKATERIEAHKITVDSSERTQYHLYLYCGSTLCGKVDFHREGSKVVVTYAEGYKKKSISSDLIPYSRNCSSLTLSHGEHFTLSRWRERNR